MDSYQGIALAMPQLLQLNCPFRGCALDTSIFTAPKSMVRITESYAYSIFSSS